MEELTPKIQFHLEINNKIIIIQKIGIYNILILFHSRNISLIK